MRADFLDANKRHWDDAEILFKEKRWANADHLYGMAAECGLKQLMLAFGMEYDEDKSRPSERHDRVHANGIWDRFESYRCGHHQGAGYVLPGSNPFQDWDVSQRYANQSKFDEARVQLHKYGAQAICELIRKAEREGLI